MIVTLWNGEIIICRRLCKAENGHHLFTDKNLMIPLHLIKEIKEVRSEEEDGDE